MQLQKRRLWSEENRAKIREKFNDMVMNQRVPIDEVRSALEEDKNLLAKLEKDMGLFGNSLVLAVKDKIRSFYRSKYGFK